MIFVWAFLLLRLLPGATLADRSERMERQMRWGRNIRVGRRAQRLTQKDFGEAVGVTQATVANWEAGRIAPRDETKARIAAVLNDQVHRLFPIAPAELTS